MRFFTALAILAVLFAAPAQALDIQRPDSTLSAKEVVSIQLKALKNNDDPRKDAGIKQTYALAHPQNKALTGPLPKFTQMLEGPLYRMMLNHRAHSIEEVAQGDGRAVFGVTIVDAAGDVYKFRWTVQKIDAGDYVGAWATVAVSPPQTADDSI
jgi:hypothetical protein